MSTGVCVLVTSPWKSIYLKDLRYRTSGLYPGYNHFSRLTAAYQLIFLCSRWDLSVPEKPCIDNWLFNRPCSGCMLSLPRHGLNSFFPEWLEKGGRGRAKIREEGEEDESKEAKKRTVFGLTVVLYEVYFFPNCLQLIRVGQYFW